MQSAKCKQQQQRQQEEIHSHRLRQSTDHPWLYPVLPYSTLHYLALPYSASLFTVVYFNCIGGFFSPFSPLQECFAFGKYCALSAVQFCCIPSAEGSAIRCCIEKEYGILSIYLHICICSKVFYIYIHCNLCLNHFRSLDCLRKLTPLFSNRLGYCIFEVPVIPYYLLPSALSLSFFALWRKFCLDFFAQ